MFFTVLAETDSPASVWVNALLQKFTPWELSNAQELSTWDVNASKARAVTFIYPACVFFHFPLITSVFNEHPKAAMS